MADLNTAASGGDGPDAEIHPFSGAGSTATGEAPFVNRVSELATLEGSLGQAIAGEGRLVLIGGEPGIGKTRLVAEFATVAEIPGRFAALPRVVLGRCWDSGGAPTLWLWSMVLRQLCDGSDPDQLRRDLGTGAAWLAALVPELQATLPELEQAPLDSEQSRFVLFDAITSFLRRLAERQPLLLVLEDAHAADQPSLLALLFLARQIAAIRALVVVTHRESEVRRRERLAPLFAKLERESLRVSLPGLAREEISQLIDHRGGGMTPELTERLHEATGGNPFFADEAVRMLLARGGLKNVGPAELVPLSAGVQAVIEQRLDALPPEVVETLRYAAATGSRFSLAVVTRASGRARVAATDDLAQAISANLIRAHEGTVGIYEFNHSLIRETITAGMSTAQQAAVHGAVGAALEHRYAGSHEAHLEELAHHFLEALAVGDPRPALHYAERAADHAMSLFAHERAARLYAAALEALDLVEGLSDRDRARARARLLLGLGRAYQRVADHRAKHTLREAAAAARAGGAADMLAGVGLTFGAFGISPGTVDPELVGLLREALDWTPAPQGRVRALLLGRLARALYWERDPAPRMALAEETIAVARRLEDPEALGSALGDSLMATRGIDTTEQALGWIDELLSIREAPREMIVAARSNEIDLLLERGQVNAADASLESLARQVERLHDLRAAPFLPVHRARRAMMEGRFGEAQELLEQAADTADRIDESTFPLTIGGGHVALDLLRGRPELVQDRVAPLVHTLPEMRLWRACLVASQVAQGEPERARRELERSLHAGVGAIPRDAMWLITVSLLSEGAAAVGEPAPARELLDVLAPFAGRNVISPVSGYRGPVDRYLGLLAASLGDEEDAESHLRSALATAQRQHAKPMQALIALDLARALLGRADELAVREAASLVELAGLIAGQLGASHLAPVLDALTGQLERLPQAVPSPVAVEAPLEGSLVREGEVWRFTLGARVVRVRDSKGVRHLARLLAAPAREIHALELVREGGGERGEAGAGEAMATGELALADPGAGSGPMLDDAAKSAYRRRLGDLEEELEEAERWRDPERAAGARAEIDFITAELAAAVGLGGRDRRAGADAERARVNVTRAVRTAIRRVTEADQELGAELEVTVRTGSFCVYVPDPRRPVAWSVSAGDAAGAH